MASKIEYKDDINISVIITTHADTEPYLEECLESIAAQIEPPHETILVVDGFKKPMIYPSITAIVRDVNRGVAYSRQEGFKLSTGNYLLFVDGDDVIPENFIMDMKSTIREKNADITYPNAILWSRWGGSKLINGMFLPPNSLDRQLFLKQNYVLVTSVMKRIVFQRIGGFDPDIPIFEDYKFFLEAYLLGFSFAKAGCYLKYRQRTNSRNRSMDQDKLRVYRKIKQELLEKYPIEK